MNSRPRGSSALADGQRSMSTADTYGYQRLPELARPEEPPFGADTDVLFRDVRGDYIGAQEAADIIGVKRTQVWRYATKGKIPYLKLGTERRPFYVYKRACVEHFARVREQRKVRNRLKELQRLLANLGIPDIHVRRARRPQKGL